MDDKKHIENLFDTFKLDDLSAQEAIEFKKVIKEGDRNDALHGLLEDKWRTAVNSKTEVPSGKMQLRILNAIESSEKKSLKPKGYLQQHFISVMRYAAIIILTIGFTLIARKSFDTHKVTVDKQVENQNEITVSYGSKSRITLPDGTVVNLNSGSTLRYPAKFAYNSRNVSIEGEAFFDVKPDHLHPFYVKTKDITIKVLGTKFNVKSYGEEPTIQATLVTGKIEVYSNKKEGPSGEKMLAVLKPNQQFIYDKKLGAETPAEDLNVNVAKQQLKTIKPVLINSRVDINPIVAWKDNKLAFRDMSFADLSKCMERWYDVEIEIRNKELSKAVLSGAFAKETVEQALNALKLATPFKYSIKKNHIIIN